MPEKMPTYADLKVRFCFSATDIAIIALLQEVHSKQEAPVKRTQPGIPVAQPVTTVIDKASNL